MATQPTPGGGGSEGAGSGEAFVGEFGLGFEPEPVSSEPPAPDPAAQPSGGASSGAPSSEGGAESVAAQPSPGQGDAADQAASPPADGTVPAPQSEPFTFAGKQYSSREAAEHAARSIAGRVAAAEKKAAENERIAREAAQIGHQWAEFYARQRPQGGPLQQPPQPQAPEKAWAETLDYDFLKELAETEGLDAAFYHIASLSDQRMQALLDEKLKGFRGEFSHLEQRHAQSVAYDQTMGLFQTAAAEQDESGAFKFPELRSDDESIGMEIVKNWTEIVRENPALLHSSRAIRYAVMEYRLAHGLPGAAKQSGSPAPPTGASAGVRQAVAAASAAHTEPLNGSGTPRPAAAGAQRSQFRELIGGDADGVSRKLKDGFELGL